MALAPLALALLLFAWRSRPRIRILPLGIIAGVSLWLAWPLLKQHYGWIYWLEHESLQLILFTAFARTLMAQRQPLCTQFAEIMHGPLSDKHIRYAHAVTVAWTAFFGTTILISTYLFFNYPLGIWSIFSNFIFLPLVILMFIVEYIVRKRALPEVAHANIMDAVRTYWNVSGRSH
ncbi:MAG: COG4648 family protein [Sulfuriferula sp.]